MTVHTAGVARPIVQLNNVGVDFPVPGRRAPLRAVDDVSFTIERGRTLGLVGESGSGKSTLGRVVLGLQRPARGTVLVLDSPAKAGAGAVAAVFQNPYASFHPMRSIGTGLRQAVAAAGVTRAEQLTRVQSLLAQVHLPSGTQRKRPHELSGGQLQRAAVARALATRPEVIVCDEVTSALDVSTRASVINLLLDLQEQTGVAYLFIGHDLPLVAHVSDEIVVLRNGKIVEHGGPDLVTGAATSPYTAELVRSSPVADPVIQRARITARHQIK
ncbi:MAG: ABC transporter ATP-binding protein [Gordonia sp. (in: high G+C Gram-positive bacteria)]